MALTRATVEAILLRRCGTALQQAGLDYTTANGENDDLNDPIGSAVRWLGGTVASAAAVSDSDLGGVDVLDHDALFDLAELRVLETCLNHVLDQVDTTLGPQSRSLAQFAAALERKIERLQERAKTFYGIGVAALLAGVADLDFMEKSNNA